MFENLIPIPIIFPILISMLIACINNKKLIALLAIMVTVVNFTVSLVLFLKMPLDSTFHYAVGNWEIPIGINLGYDSLAIFMMLLINTIAVADSLRSMNMLNFDILPERNKFYVTTLLLTLGAYNGMILTNDLFNLYVFTEISSLSVYIMVGLATNRRAPFAAYNYLIIGTIGATFYILGVGFLYALTGTLNMHDMHQLLKTIPLNNGIELGFSFIFIGWILKVAWFPMHNRLLQIYTSEPIASLPFLGATSSKIASYAFIRVILGVFGVEFFTKIDAHIILSIIGITSLLWGGICALRATHMRATLAWSSISQLGYIAIGLSLANVEGITSALMFVFTHAISKGLAFMALLTICWQLNRTDVQDHHLAGVAWKSPLTVTALAIAMFSLLGFPGTIGFLAKWSLFKAAIYSNRWDLIASIIVGTLLAIGYTWRELHTVLFEIKVPKSREPIIYYQLTPTIKIALLILITIIIYGGINFPAIYNLAEQAAQSVIAGNI